MREVCLSFFLLQSIVLILWKMEKFFFESLTRESFSRFGARIWRTLLCILWGVIWNWWKLDRARCENFGKIGDEISFPFHERLFFDAMENCADRINVIQTSGGGYLKYELTNPSFEFVYNLFFTERDTKRRTCGIGCQQLGWNFVIKSNEVLWLNLDIE